jgi:hypothetical protein
MLLLPTNQQMCYPKHMRTFEESEKRLRAICGERMFQYHLTYSDAEGCYYAVGDGLAKTEFAEVKRASTLQEAVDRLADRIEEKYPTSAG